MELEEANAQREHELRLAQTNSRGSDVDETEEDATAEVATGGAKGGDQRRSRAEILADKVKRYGSALKQVVAPMPSDASEIPQFFESLEAMFCTFEVPEDLQAKLLLPFLSVKAKMLISRLCAQELENFQDVRDFILSEFKLTSREYKLRFDTATKRSDETYTFFAARLKNNLRYFFRSRECLNDYDRLFALLISDKLKSCLPSAALNYVLSSEANEWFGPARIAELADTYVSHHGEREKMRQVNSTHVTKDTEARSEQSKGRFGRTSYDARESQPYRDISCFCCGRTGHIAKYCPQNEAEVSIRGGEQSQGERQPERVRRCFRCQSSRHLIKDCPKINEVSVNGEQVEDEARINACFGSIKPSITGRVVYNDRVNRGYVDECDRIALMCTSDRDDAIDECKATTWEFDVYPQIKTVTSNCTGVVNTGVKLSNLKYLDVMVNGERCVSLVDSGAEIGVVSEGLADKLQVETCGHINVRGIFGDYASSIGQRNTEAL